MKADEKMQHEIKDLRREVDALRQQRLKRDSLTEAEPEPASPSKNNQQEQSEDASLDVDWSDLESIFQDLVSSTNEEIGNHPLGAVSIAFLLGFTLGRTT